MDPAIRIYRHPRLKNPSLIAGWADAGLIGISAIDYLTEKLGAEELGEIEPYDFASLPYSLIRDGVMQDIEYPASNFYYWKNKKSGEDLILFGGKPPAVHHYDLANLILDVAQSFQVKRVYTVGGINSDVAHTTKPKVTAIINATRLKDFMKQHRVPLVSDYHGPTSMNGLVLGLAKYRSIEGIGLWGRVPNYIGDIPNPKACRAVLKTLTSMLDLTIDFSTIENEARQANKQIDELVSYMRQQSPELDRHITVLEKNASFEIPETEKRKLFDQIQTYLRETQEKDRHGD